ncbi:flagellar motor switch protein FliN, partial [Actinoplanes sp. NPDC048791]
MTAPTITDPQLALVRSAAEAALAVLPTSRELLVGAPVSASADMLTTGQAVTARFSGAATGEVVVVVGQDLA